SPGATFCRPLRGLRFFLGIVPPVRGLTGGYVLSPAARAPVFLGDRTPGSRTHRGPAFCRPLRGLRSFLGIVPPVRGLTGGQRSVARFAGSGLSWASYPRFADSPGASVLSPALRAPVFLGHRTPGSRTHRGPAFCRPLCGLRSFLGIVPPVRGLTGGLHSVARCAGSCY